MVVILLTARSNCEVTLLMSSNSGFKYCGIITVRSNYEFKLRILSQQRSVLNLEKARKDLTNLHTLDTEKMRVFLLLMVVSTVFGCLRNSQSFFETEYNDFLSTQKCFGGNCQVNTKVTNCDGQECEGHVFSQTVGEDVFGPGSNFAKIFGRR